MTNIPINKLLEYEHTTNSPRSIFFENVTKDYVNIFTYNGVTYIGLETERLRYDDDKIKGTNYVENLIKLGMYS
jgi:hypothetical protein